VSRRVSNDVKASDPNGDFKRLVVEAGPDTAPRHHLKQSSRYFVEKGMA
jgi:hypothetical protein